MVGNRNVSYEIVNGFTLANKPMLVTIDEHFSRLQTTIVLITHSVAVGTRVLHNDDVAERDAFGQHALLYPKVRVFADLSAEADWLAGFIFTTVDVDVVICAIHGGAGERVHGDVRSNDSLVGILDGMDGSDDVTCVADEISGRLHHEPRRLETVFIDFLREDFRDELSGFVDVQRSVFMLVGDAETAAEIDEFEIDAELFADLSDIVHQKACDEFEIFWIADAGAGHHVGTETLDASLFSHAVGIHDLVWMDTEFGVGTAVADEIADFARPVAGVEAEGEEFRFAVFENARQDGNVVQIENDARLQALLNIVVRQEVAGEHDVVAAEPKLLGEKDFIDGRGVDSRAFLAEDVRDGQIVVGLDGVEETEVGVVFFEGVQRAAEIVAYAVFLIDVGGRAVSLRNERDGNVFQIDLAVLDFHGMPFTI